MKSCRTMPEKGQDTFSKLRKEFGYNKAVTIFNKVTGNDFSRLFGDSVTFDSDGVPTFESLIKLPIIRNYVGQQTLMDSLNKKQPHLVDNSENVATLIRQAQEFNKGENSNEFVAIVDYDENENITINIVPKTKENSDIAEYQSKIQKLNETAASILEEAGIVIEDLSSIETSVGRVGVTEFKHLSDMLNNFTVVIRVANNLEGFNAISEEFAHFIVGINKNDKLVKRSIDYLKNEKAAREILGSEFDKVYEYHEGDMNMVAEEAAGKIFREVLLDVIYDKNIERPSLFKRMFNSILRPFKGINPAYYKNAIDAIKYDYSKIAKDIITGKRKITKQDIQKARREASFNALSERIDTQISALKTIINREKKNAILQKDIENGNIGNTKRALLRRANEIQKAVDSIDITNESMKAITKTVSILKKDMDLVIKQLKDIDTLPMRDRFRVLENALSIFKGHSQDLEEIDSIISEEFMQDESIRNQHFMMDDISDNLKEYRNEDGIEKKDTSSMDSEEIINLMDKDGKEWDLAKDEVDYANNKTGEKAIRVTTSIEATEDATIINPNNPYVKPSTNIGTCIDEFVRDFFSGRIVKTDGRWTINGKALDEVYPNATDEDLNTFADQLDNLRQYFKGRGITIVARDIKAVGTIETIDGTGKVHRVNCVGTLDLIGYDKKGNFHIFDMKTHRGKIDISKKNKWSKQLTLYKKFLEERYGIKVVETAVIPISVSYPSPIGTPKGIADYSVSTAEKPEDYLGIENNQLLIDGEEFREARPFRERLIPIKTSEFEFIYSALADDPTNGKGNGYEALMSVIKDSKHLLSEIKRLFNDKSMPLFVKFISEFIGDEIEIADPDNKGKFKTVSVEYLIKNGDVDITWTQKMLTTMADNPDTLLQIFDKIVKDKKHAKRLKVINMSQKILALGIKYEKLGIKDYSFMFEEDKLNYINRYYNKSAYDRDYKEFLKELDKKYGNVTIGSSEYKAKKKERIEWLDSHTKSMEINGSNKTIPNPELYPSKFNNLSQVQKDLYDEWMSIKEELDSILGEGKTTLTNSIKIRKSNIERIRGLMNGNAIHDLIEKAKSLTQRSYDDDTSYAKGIRDIEGNEKMVLPILYTSLNGQSSEDISTDIISTLIAYADMVYNYEAMNDVVDALEIGKEVILNKRKIGKRKNNKEVKERYTPKGEEIIEKVTINTRESVFAEALQNFFESKIYGIHQKSVTEYAGVDANKAVTILTKIGSAVQLGFNFFANVANLVSGVAMANIEAYAKEYFSASDLRKADTLYLANVGEMLKELESRVTFSKFGLISQMFDMKLNFSKLIKNTNFINRNFLTRFFGPSIQFIGQEAGDHWLYHRTAFALLNKYKLKQEDKEIDIWDAYDVVPIDINNKEAGNKLVLKDGVTKLDGSEFTSKDIAELAGKIWEMNKNLYGIYNTEDTLEARRYILGKLAMQYRDWMPALYRHRFGKATSNLEGGRRKEGFYITSWRFTSNLIKDLRNGQMNIKQSWDSLDKNEQKNIRRAIAETAQLLLAVAVMALLKGDPKERPWAMRSISYLSTRAVTELGALSPFGAWSEGRKILKSPFAASSVVDNIDGLKSLLWIPNYFDEIQSGDYKGHSSAYKAFMKSPFMLWYGTVKRHTKPERAEKYFDK